jgi:hypothetical protein
MVADVAEVASWLDGARNASDDAVADKAHGCSIPVERDLVSGLVFNTCE